MIVSTYLRRKEEGASPSICTSLGWEMMEDLEDKWEQLRLMEEENSVIELGIEHLGKVTAEGERSLVGKLQSNRKISKDVIRSTMAKI